MLRFEWPKNHQGANECNSRWRGSLQYVNNPVFTPNYTRYSKNIRRRVFWTHWQDNREFFGTDESGRAPIPWSNEGVQYGLKALRDKKINPQQFLDLNSKIGSWKPQSEMEEEHIWLPFGRKMPFWLSLWGNQNITNITDGVASRHAGSIKAMQAAYRTGQVFIGKISLPIIDVRHYLEEDLDMHHVSASFYSRLRIIERRGHSDNHVIWISDRNYNPAVLAFKQMDEWLLKLNSNPEITVIAAKPKRLSDSCFSASGEVLFQGKNTWDGLWNSKKDGACQKIFPMYSTSRIQAGGSWSGDMFKCKTISVDQAINQDIYGSVNIRSYQQQLEKIFPQGVCDYSQLDQGRPSNL